MSLDTWKEEFYPVTADALFEEVQSNDLEVLDLELLKHSLKKWEGLLPENLEKHGVELDKFFDVVEHEHNGNALRSFGIDDVSCALCAAYLHLFNRCKSCPIYKNNNGLACGSDSEYYVSRTTNTPMPMIETLRKLVAEYEKV